MILAVETNFILELVLGQREAAACEALLEFSRGSLVIFIPAFSIAEATMVVERRQGERREFIDNTLQRHLREANRSTLLARFAPTLAQVKAELHRADIDENDRMKFFRAVESESLKMVPLDAQVLARAVDYQLNGHIEQFPDSVVFASVISALGEIPETLASTPKYFLSRDNRFRGPWYLAELRRVGCNLLSSFNDALAVARKHL
jgi:predicted nucleic acid-binding protein